MKFLIIIFAGLFFIESFKAQECSAKYDPYITTFDQMRYGFQYSGDHFIMYDDFKGTRVTSGFEKCSYGACTCAVYVQKNRKLMFVDFCDVQNNKSPTSKVYAVSVERNYIGPKAIREIPSCPFISSSHQNNQETWHSIPTILDSFKCARLQGSNYYTYYLIRTVENRFEDSLLVKFQLKNRGMPILTIRAPNSANQSTGGLCGRWDGNKTTDLYVLDRHGLESFVSTSNLSLIKEFWNLNSVYNKRSSYTKRCAECMLMSERSFYCPCDDFDLFDQNNYNLPPNRLNYCKVPMHACVEKHFSLEMSDQNASSTDHSLTSTKLPFPNSTTLPVIDDKEAYDICWTNFASHPSLNKSLANGCLDKNSTLQFCIDDVKLTSDPSVVQIHIESSIDILIQNILTNESSCDLNDLQMLCPNSCSGNGVCKFEQRCLLPGLINDNCSYPVKCECKSPFGGHDCSQDLTSITEFTISPGFCDLREENCGFINGFGYPFSTRDPIYAKVEYIEYDIDNKEHLFTETAVAETLTDNNILLRLKSLKYLNLYKNIKGIKTNFISKNSTAEIRIYLSYSNVSFVQSASLTLYDSNCRNEDQRTGKLVLLNDKCDIDGVCLSKNQTNANFSLICDPNISAYSWTDPLCNGKNSWTEWFNYDSPDTDGGDFELYRDNQYGCKYPRVVQARTVDGIEANQTGQVNWLVPLYGFFCFNKENINGCADYQIRQCCDKFELQNFSTTRSPHTDHMNWESIGSLLRTIGGHASFVSSLISLSNGDLASGSYDSTIRIWNPLNGSLLRTLKGHTFYITSLALLKNGNLASGSYDTTIKIWNPLNGSLLRTIENPNSTVSSLASLKNENLASGHSDSRIKIWDPLNGSLIRILEGHNSVVSSLATLSNGDLASGSFDATIKIWNPLNGSLLRTIKGSKLFSSLVLLMNGYLASGSADSTIKIWNPLNGSLIRTLEGHNSTVTTLTVYENGNLASGSTDKTVKIWNPNNGSLLRTQGGFGNTISSLASLSNKYLAIGSYETTIRVWNSFDGSLLRNLEGHLFYISTLAALQNGDLASGSGDRTIKIWNPLNGSLIRTLLAHDSTVTALITLSNGNLASGSKDKTIKIWNPIDGSLISKLEAHDSTVTALITLPNGNLVSGSKDKTIKIWNPLDGSLIQTLEGHTSGILSLAILKNGYLASGFEDASIKILNPFNGSLLKTLEGHKFYVSSLASLSNGNLASGSTDKTIRIWNPNNGSLLRTLEGHSSYISTLISLPNGYIASGSTDRTIRLWNPFTGSLLKTLEGHSLAVSSLVSLQNGDLVSGSDDSTIKIWDL